MKVRLLFSLSKHNELEDNINSYKKVIETFDENALREKKSNYLKEVENVYSAFSAPTSKINFIRTKLGEDGLKRGKKDGPGIYQLNLPTGAGKTLISLRYSMHQLDRKSVV